MARYVELHGRDRKPFTRDAAADTRLEAELQWELEMMFSDRHAQEVAFRESRRQYAAVPRVPYRNTPVPDAPNVEVPLGAIASDALYAQITTTLYSGSPLLTARALDDPWIEHAKEAQRWTNYLAANEVHLRDATDHAFADCIQLGTAGYYIPYTEETVNGRVSRVTTKGPRIIPIAPENLLFLGGSRGMIHDDRWMGIRWWLSPGEMRLRSRVLKWDMAKAMPCASTDWVRRQHEQLGLTNSSTSWKEQFEVIEFFIYHDYYNDGVDLDLHVFYDRSSQRILDVYLNEYDERPVVPMRYQVRPHLAYGLGVMDMLRPFQAEASEVHNHRLLNMLIANVRHWIAKQGSVPDNLEIWANKVTFANDPKDIQALPMGDVYPSSIQAEEIVTALAERRVGTEGGVGAGASAPHSIGTRTPGITTMSVMQAQNSRFTPAFDQMRLGTCEALRQCLLRQRERILAGDKDLPQHMREVLGEGADLVEELLRHPNFHRYVAVEFTALSPQTNAAADQQAMTMLWQTAAANYYKPIMEMVAAVSQPGTNPALLDVAKQIAAKSTELFDRFLRTFDQTRDPKQFLLDLTESLDKVGEGQQQQNDLQQVLQSMFGGQDGGGQGGPQGAPVG